MKITRTEVEIGGMDALDLDSLKKLFKEKQQEGMVMSAPMHRRKEARDSLKDMEDEYDDDEPYGDDADLHSSKTNLSNLPPDVSANMTGKKPKKRNEKK